MTARADSGQSSVINIDLGPIRGDMTDFTIVICGYMLCRLAGSRRSIMTTGAGASDGGVIHPHLTPAGGAMTGLALVAR